VNYGIKRIVFVTILRIGGCIPRLGLSPRTRPIVRGEL
jgi:hypothetical protein